jgi:hypothetical protein
MFDGRILDRNKMKLVPKAIPVVSFICSNEGFKHSDDRRARFKCWAILGPPTGKGGAYGRSFCPVGDQQWESMVQDVATMHELHPEILRSRRAFADWLVRLLLAFEIYQAEYERRAQAFIKAMTDFDADSQDESDGEEPSFDQDGEVVPDPEDPDSALPFINMSISGSSTCKHRRRVFLELACSQRHNRKKVQCACCQKWDFWRLMHVAHYAFPASHPHMGDKRRFTAKTDWSLFRLECITCSVDNGTKSGWARVSCTALHSPSPPALHGAVKGPAKKKKSGTPVVGGWVRVRKRTRVRFIFSIFFYRVFELPSSRNAQKRD